MLCSLRSLATFALRSVPVCLFVLLATGCPHRSPVWSPDGSKLLVLAGANEEACDHSASQLWLVDVTTGKGKTLALPEANSRLLAAVWIDNQTFVTFTGRWEGNSIAPESEKVWRGDGSKWTEMKLPRPNAARVTRRIPVLVESDGQKALAYPVGDEGLVVVALSDGKVLAEFEPAELIGPGAQGGILIYQPEDSEDGGVEVAAVGNDLKQLWAVNFANLRTSAAKRLGKTPFEIVFNDTSTSHRPPGNEKGWVGMVMVFSDVSWPDGINGYYFQLDEKTGELKNVVAGHGTSGLPTGAKDSVWATLAPSRKGKLPMRVARINLTDGKPSDVAPLAGVAKTALHGYSLSPAGDRVAVSINGETPSVKIYKSDNLEELKTIPLK
ncbi:MAG: hypothetical protein MK538_13705 [Planctomycetes bacterium]|nr:hypothetical protein [Planctomycetota bacterium]